ncbi:MAG: hypothetical protein M3O09_04265 [Acidobacteriota bacterium]|nr:hypothetical protein [Acidobacteriota bacterium]
MPVSENRVKLVSGEAKIAQATRVIQKIRGTYKGDQSNPILTFDLQDKASIIESLVAVGSPDQMFRVHGVPKLLSRHSEEQLAFFTFSISGASKCRRNTSGVCLHDRW